MYGLPCHDDSDESSDESHEEQSGEPRTTPTKPREETSIEKPAKKKGRPPLSEAQKEILRLGREKSRRNQVKRMAQEKLAKIEKEETNETNMTVNKKKSKKQVIVETQPDDTSEEEIIYVSKCKKKKKPRKNLLLKAVAKMRPPPTKNMKSHALRKRHERPLWLNSRLSRNLVIVMVCHLKPHRDA